MGGSLLNRYNCYGIAGGYMVGICKDLGVRATCSIHKSLELVPSNFIKRSFQNQSKLFFGSDRIVVTLQWRSHPLESEDGHSVKR
jgi:hypothetical protein